MFNCVPVESGRSCKSVFWYPASISSNMYQFNFNNYIIYMEQISIWVEWLGEPSNLIFGKIWEFGPTRSTPKSKIGLQQLILAAKRYVSFFGSPCIKNKSKQCRRVKIDDVAVPCLNDTVSANMPKARGGQLLFLRKEGNWSPILRMLPER